MSGLSVYSFAKVSCIFNGIPISGWFEGDDVISIKRGDDAARAMVGADGSALVSISTNQSAVIELKLQPSSISNGILGLFENKFRRGLRVPPVGLVITDYQTAEVMASSTAIVMSRPKDINYGTNATVRVWQLFCGKLVEGSIGQL